MARLSGEALERIQALTIQMVRDIHHAGVQQYGAARVEAVRYNGEWWAGLWTTDRGLCLASANGQSRYQALKALRSQLLN